MEFIDVERGRERCQQGFLFCFDSLSLPIFSHFELFLETDKCGADCFVVEMFSSPGTNQNLD